MKKNFKTEGNGALEAKPQKAKKEPRRQRTKKANLFSNVKIAPKLLAGFLIIALLAAGMGVFAAFNIRTLSDSAKQLHVNVLLPTQNMAAAMSNFDKQRVTLRQALINEDDLYTDVYISTINNSYTYMASQFDLISKLIPAESKEAFDKLQSDYDVYKQSMEQAMTKLKEGDKAFVTNELLKGDLRVAENNVEDAMEDLKFSITSSSSSTSLKNQKLGDNVYTITLGIAGFVLVLSVTIGILIALGISRPIKRLTGDAKRLASGEIDIDIAGFDTKDEVGQIRQAFKTILQVIRDLTQDTNMLISAAAQGELTVRADATKHEGAYRSLVEGINTMLDSTVTPMVESAKALGELANGNLNVSVEGNFEGDFAIVKNAFNGTVETLKSYIGEITTVMERVAGGMIDTVIEAEYKGDFVALKTSINQSIEAFNGVLKDIDTASEEVSLGTLQLSSGSQTISQGATEQASALEELTAALTEIAGETARNAERAGKANEMSLKAKDYALSGNEKMKALQAAMQEINVSSANISKIIRVIDDIAFQTNILSLNAAVEAARAGVHGKGFAVVADEVRSLAARSANAAKETTELIENSIKKTNAGTKIADETAKALLEIVDEVEKTVELSGEIAQASSGQAAGIDQVGKGIEQLSVVVQTNSATAQEAAASAEELSAQAEYLKNMVRKFQLKDTVKHEPKRAAMAQPERTAAPQSKIVLNDNDFGKY